MPPLTLKYRTDALRCLTIGGGLSVCALRGSQNCPPHHHRRPRPTARRQHRSSSDEMQQIRALDREARYFNMPYEDQMRWFMQWNPTD